MSAAGKLRGRVSFWSRTADAKGRPLGEAAEVFRRDAELVRLRGGEAVQAGRLKGSKPTLIRVRACAQTRSIETSWTAREVRSAEAFKIRDVTPTADGAWVEILCEAG